MKEKSQWIMFVSVLFLNYVNGLGGGSIHGPYTYLVA